MASWSETEKPQSIHGKPEMSVREAKHILAVEFGEVALEKTVVRDPLPEDGSVIPMPRRQRHDRTVFTK